MATINLTGTNSYFNGKVEWTSTEDIATNTSSVTCILYIKKSDGYTTSGTYSGSWFFSGVGAQTKSIGKYFSLGQSWTEVDRATHTVNHNADGTGSFTLTVNVKGPSGTSLASHSVSISNKTVSLPQIPRAGSLLSATNFNDEENPKITYSNPAGSSASVSCRIESTDGNSVYVDYKTCSNTSTEYTFSLSDAERDTLRNAIPNSKTMNVVFRFRTIIGSNYYYSTLTQTFTIINGQPTFSPSVVDTNTTTIALTGDNKKLVRYYSNAAITIGATAIKGASISSKKATNGAKSITADGTINAIESLDFALSATDSRGFTGTTVYKPTVIDYIKLTCNIENKTPGTDGSFVFTVKGNYFNSTFGSVANTLNVMYRYKDQGGSYSNWLDMTVTKSGNTYIAESAKITGLDYQKTYIFQALAFDKLSSMYTDEKPIKSLPIFDWGKDDFAFNVPVTINGVSVRTEKTLFEGSAASVSLSDINFSDYDYIEIFFTDNNGKGSGYAKVYSPEGKEVHVNLVETNGYNSFYIRHTNYSITRGNITPITGKAGLSYFSGSSWTGYNNNYLLITRVVGWR